MPGSTTPGFVIWLTLEGIASPVPGNHHFPTKAECDKAVAESDHFLGYKLVGSMFMTPGPPPVNGVIVHARCGPERKKA